MNYEELGFKAGIEIHQQVDSDEKLFCSCPVDLRDEAKDKQVERFLQSVGGETGEKDVAARVEDVKSRKFVYNYYKRNNCLVEIDEEPPHQLDEEALNTALTFARMVNADIPDEIQVMRKMVVDGSNTTGFQRTAMVGLEGELETESGSVKIDDIELEEESAGIHSRSSEKAIYDLNRLGIPLIEVGTDASIKNPEHAREVAEKIGMLLRSTGKARRGLGTIRQDVNVSIDEGARVEIKGFQDVKNIDKLIELEVQRQKNLVKLGNELDNHEVNSKEVTKIFEQSENEIISTVLENNGVVYGLKFPDLGGRMKEKISGERYLAKELVDYAKSRGLQGIIHTEEEISKYNLKEEFETLKSEMNKNEGDVIAIIAGPEENAEAASKAVRERAEKLYRGDIPEETRNAEQNFTTSYSRPLPGAARMYPETDITPIQISEEKVQEIDRNLPKTLEERKEEYSEEIGEELASQIISSPRLNLFEEFKERIDPKLAANIFTNVISKLEAEEIPVENLDKRHFETLFKHLKEGEAEKGDIEDILEKMSREPEKDPDKSVEEIISQKTGEEEIREKIQQIIQKKSDLVEEQGMRAQGALMGLVMQEVNAPGDKVSKILQEELEKTLN